MDGPLDRKSSGSPPSPAPPPGPPGADSSLIGPHVGAPDPGRHPGGGRPTLAGPRCRPYRWVVHDRTCRVGGGWRRVHRDRCAARPGRTSVATGRRRRRRRLGVVRSAARRRPARKPVAVAADHRIGGRRGPRDRRDRQCDPGHPHPALTSHQALGDGPVTTESAAIAVHPTHRRFSILDGETKVFEPGLPEVLPGHGAGTRMPPSGHPLGRRRAESAVAVENQQARPGIDHRPRLRAAPVRCGACHLGRRSKKRSPSSPSEYAGCSTPAGTRPSQPYERTDRPGSRASNASSPTAKFGSGR